MTKIEINDCLLVAAERRASRFQQLVSDLELLPVTAERMEKIEQFKIASVTAERLAWKICALRGWEPGAVVQFTLHH
jgi:hypothetical protein